MTNVRIIVETAIYRDYNKGKRIIMKVYELLNFNKELLHKIHVTGLKVDDYKYVDMYTDYLHLKNKNEKVTYIVNHLSEKYAISERQVYSVVCRMQKEITTADSMQLKTD